MRLSRELLSGIFQQVTAGDANFQEALEVVRQNSSGRIWLTGGFLYKSLAHHFYGSKKETKDFDFLVERANPRIIIPEGWEQETNTFGNIKFINRSKKIKGDFIPLAEVYYIKAKKVIPCIANYFTGMPLNVHCLAYDIQEKKVIGIAGIKALEKRVVRVQNLEMLEYGARVHQTTPDNMIREKASELGFKAELV